MSKYRYRISPPLYRIGEAESYYSEMAAKGYLLRKRIWFLDRFEAGEPKQLEYRIEMAERGELVKEYGTLSEKENDRYEEAGWHYVTGNSGLSVFAADRNQEVPDIPASPRLQRETLKSLRGIHFSAILSCIVWTLAIVLFGIRQPGTGLVKVMARSSGCLALILVISIFCLLRNLYAMGVVGKTMRRLKKGNPIDHHGDWRKGRKGYQIFLGLFALLLVPAAGELVREEFGMKTRGLPTEGEGKPYLLLSELEEGVRRATARESEDVVGYPDQLREKHTLAAPLIYMTYEKVVSQQETGYSCWMYQDYYETCSEKFAMDLAADIMKNSIWLDSPAEYEALESRTMDLVRASKLELLAVKDNRVIYITYPGDVPKEEILAVLEEKWK